MPGKVQTCSIPAGGIQMSSSFNRREFLALAASAPLGLRSAYSSTPAGQPIPYQAAQPPRASESPMWVRQGIVAASNMESLCFVRRRGGQDLNYAEELRADLSDATVSTL